MVKKDLEEKLEIPDKVSVTKEYNKLVISGPAGSIEREYDNPKVKITVKEGQITLSCKSATKVDKSIIKTFRAHIKNNLAGSVEKFVYKLKICSGHFPMSVSVNDGKLNIKNFVGEKVPRVIELKEGVDVKVEGNLIIVEGPDKELTGQVAADIEQATRRPGFDKRIFQDGIYLIIKAGKEIK